MILLADPSQGSLSEYEFNEKLSFVPKENQFQIKNVYRTSQRVSSACSNYQRDKMLKETTCSHSMSGDKVETYLIQDHIHTNQKENTTTVVKAESTDINANVLMQAKAILALKCLHNQFSRVGSLSLHLRSGIVVPSKNFLNEFKSVLVDKNGFIRSHLLREAGFPEGTKIKVIDALENMKHLDRSKRNANDPCLLTVDTYKNMGGLELMSIIGVGLDGSFGKDWWKDLEICTRIYNTMSRALLSVALVDVHRSNGFLSWLLFVKKKEDEELKESTSVDADNDNRSDELNEEYDHNVNRDDIDDEGVEVQLFSKEKKKLKAAKNQMDEKRTSDRYVALICIFFVLYMTLLVAQSTSLLFSLS